MSNLKANDFWRPNQSYYASDRVKTLLLHDDKFYVCSEPHLSGSTFDPSKFILVSGGGSGGSLVPVGNWDIASSTTSGGIVESTITLTEPYDAFIADGLTVLSGGAMSYPFVGPYGLFSAATTPTVIND